ncbi:hypothetical protein SAMN05428982_1793 [Pseudoxanthomonas sp. CF385]|uniref:DUF1801 domain-containing protein n=1 Tax=Pseudoxanthomonas sp. CF385 TaxID=1881042 RepID=UPI00088D292F|nr:DUF1801 domain-containing protein [Pseudoxanthomonas sp. CF385]SDQ60815.1 hypothetical protein SAMN05428982_1793 [Pseudoxanthomonas sp. CF385]
MATKKAATKKAPARKAVAKQVATKPTSPRLLSGGNPQIPKGEGDAPVRAYLAAVPGWKQALAKRLDALVEKTVPGVRKAVKWNSPLYGAPGAEGWFLSFHCFERYLKVTFFRGQSLRPVPPEASKVPDVRYLHLREGEAFDEALLGGWIAQASRLPGEKM